MVPARAPSSILLTAAALCWLALGSCGPRGARPAAAAPAENVAGADDAGPDHDPSAVAGDVTGADAGAGDGRPGDLRGGAMVPIPAGTFEMGSDTGGPSGQPVHRVAVAAFFMDLTEVTVAAYEACVGAGACTADNLDSTCTNAGCEKLVRSAYCNRPKPDRAEHPINCVDWNQAMAFCRWARKRLPTEEEWEYAARGTDGRTYPWGNAEPGSQLCWDGEGSNLGKGKRESTCVVRSYPAGTFGLFDMAGNVWEWTASGSSLDYSKNRTNAARVYRGGGWSNNGPSYVRSAARTWTAPGLRFYYLGLRCAR